MSSITLSQAVRSNLLSLQNTASLLDTTQTRLATGNKVNSALDNPTSYFTATGLNSRASDLGNLLDSVSNAVQTIQAANDGITSITKLVESAQATANQALQLQATVTTATAATAGTVTAGAFSPIDVSGTASSATSATLSSSGFSALNLGSAGSAATNAATTGSVDITAGAGFIDASGGAITFTINSQTVTLATNGGTSSDGHYSLTDLKAAINTQVGVSASVNATDDGSGHLVLTSTGTAGASDAIVTTGTAAAGLGIADSTYNGAAAVAADSVSFDLTVGSTTQTITLNHSTAASNHGAVTAAEVATAINLQFGSNVADGSSGQIVFTDSATGTTSHVQLANVAHTGNASTSGLSNGNNNGSAAAAADSISFTATIDGTAHAVTLSAASVAAYNTATTSSLTANNLTAANVAAIANQQIGATVATVSGGALVFTSTTTGLTSSVALSAVTNAGTPTGSTGVVSATNTGAAASSTSTPNPARAALVSQYNGLLDQIDQLTSDAGYNGNNLLSGASSQLKVTFNETGTSSLTISGKDTSATGLGLAKLTVGTEFDTNASITTILGNLKTAQDTLRSDASSFGSNLSIVQTRQDFTKALINTLQTGASNLTLADSNEEAANLLALQTRQSLSTKALSLASQSDQNVLRLLQ